jgi:hypothetical protein
MKEKIMANNNNGKAQNKATTGSSSYQNQNKAQRDSRSRANAMTPEEAGHLGGVAPHECRGFECQKGKKDRE